MKSLYLESGINHFGNIKEAHKILNFFLKSKLRNLTFMLQTDEFYRKQKSLGIDFKLPENFYKLAIDKIHSKNKKIGLSVCRLKTYNELSHLKFDFFKILGAGVSQNDLIKKIKKKNKPVFISTGFNVSKKQLKKCLFVLGPKIKTSLLYAPMTYKKNELNLNKINDLKKTFSKPVGFSNHHNDKEILSILTAYKPSALFIYCKPTRKKGRNYPDDKHAFFLDEINEIKDKFDNYSKMTLKAKRIKKINIFANEFKF